MDWSSLGVQIFEALLPIIVPAAVGALFAFAKRQLAEAKLKQPDTMSDLIWIAEAAVRAAEQAGAAGIITNKKNYALNVTQGWLDQKGIKLDARLVDAAIEGAVWNEINKDADKPQPKPTGFIAQ